MLLHKKATQATVCITHYQHILASSITGPHSCGSFLRHACCLVGKSVMVCSPDIAPWAVSQNIVCFQMQVLPLEELLIPKLHLCN